MKHRNTGNRASAAPYLLINTAVALFAMSGVLTKLISAGSILITFYRVAISSCVLLLFNLATGKNLHPQSRADLIRLIGTGILLALHWVTFLGSVKISTVAIGTITYSSFPLFVTLIEPLIHKTKLTRQNVISCVLILAGVIITVPQVSFENNMFVGILVGLISAFLYALISILNKSVSGRYEPTVISFYEQFSAAVILLPAALYIGPALSLKDAALMCVMGVVVTAIAYTMFVSSLKEIDVQIAGILASMETVYGIVLALVFLQEIPSVRELAGGSIVLAVVICTQVMDARRTSPA